jgi:hypothetical protein
MPTSPTRTTTSTSGRRSKGFRRLLILGVVGMLLLAACGTTESDSEQVIEPTTTTSSAATDPTTPATSAVPAADITLSSNGLGIVDLGADPEAAIAAVSADLGAPTFDTGWVDAGNCPGTEYREVAWDALTLQFNDAADATAPDGGRHFFGYSYGGGDAGLTTAEGIGPGATVADLEAAYGTALSIEDNPAVGPLWQVEAHLFFGGGLSGIAADDVVTSIQGGIKCAE